MKTWGLERLVCDTARVAKGAPALIVSLIRDVLDPPFNNDIDWPLTDGYRASRDGAEQLAEREAEEEVGEPCHCGRCDADDVRRLDEARERIGDVDDFVPGDRPGLRPWDRPADKEMPAWVYTPEPALTDDELVAVRGLIQERYENFAGAAASLADGAFVNNPSVREDKRLAGGPVVAPHTDTPAVERSAAGATDGQAAPFPPGVACPSPNLVDWLEPAIYTELEAHRYRFGFTTNCACDQLGINHWTDWYEHVAPLIAQRIELALRTTDFDFNPNATSPKGSE